MGTPNDEIWPGVSELPDYKSTFPQWSPQPLENIIKNLDEVGLDVLQVSIVFYHLVLVLTLSGSNVSVTIKPVVSLLSESNPIHGLIRIRTP
jgi:hypothetical protein